MLTGQFTKDYWLSVLLSMFLVTPAWGEDKKKEMNCASGFVATGIAADGAPVCQHIGVVLKAAEQQRTSGDSASAKGIAQRLSRAKKVKTKTDTDRPKLVKDLGEGRFQIPRNFGSHLNFQEWSRAARVIPHYVKGKPRGFKLIGIRPKSPVSALGFQNGDIMIQFNGQAIKGPSAALKAWNSILKPKDFSITLLRDGREIKHRYEVDQKLVIPPPPRDSADDTKERLERGRYFWKNTRQKDPHNYEVNQGMLASLTPKDLAQAARAITHYERGQERGVKLVGIRATSLYRYLGIRSGDVIIEVNEMPADYERLSKVLIAAGRVAENIVLRGKRRGVPFVRTVQVVKAEDWVEQVIETPKR